MALMNIKDMTLSVALDSGMYWTEEVPPGTVEQSTGSFGTDFGSKVMNIKISGGSLNLKAAIKSIIGYSQVITDMGRMFDPNDPVAQFRSRLNRVTPVTHSELSGLVATKILSVQGRGIDKMGPNRGVGGTSGNWEYTYLSVLFEVPKYPIIPDTGAGRELQHIPHRWRNSRIQEVLPFRLRDELRNGRSQGSCLEPMRSEGQSCYEDVDGGPIRQDAEGEAHHPLVRCG